MATQATSRNVALLLARTARSWPRLPAVALGDRAVCEYATLADRAARIAAALGAAGVQRGDRVALVSRNLPEYIEALFGCWWAGLVAVPINAKLHPRELAFILANSDARWAFVDAPWHAAIGAGMGEKPTLERVVVLGGAEYRQLVSTVPSAEPAVCDEGDPAWLFYTSGTTGRPKGVAITHANLRAMSQCFLTDVEAVAPGDAILHAAPMSHGSGLYILPHILAGAVNVVPESGSFDPDEIVALLDTWDRASFFAAPTMAKRLVGAPALAGARLDRLKSIVLGG